MFKKDCLINPTLVGRDGEGRWVKVEFTFMDRKWILLNIYAPNVEKDRVLFFMDMQQTEASCDIIMGDFNVKCGILDSGGVGPLKADASRTLLKNLMLNYEWCDVWRQANPASRTYSRIQNVEGSLKRSRVDLCLVRKNQMNNFHSARYDVNCLSDHAFLKVTVGILKRGKGGGLWHLNASLLENEHYIKQIRNLILTWSSQPAFINDIINGWQDLKIKIKQKSIIFAKKVRFKESQKIRKIKAEIDSINMQGVVDEDTLRALYGSLKECENRKWKGVIVRSRVQYAVEGERSTSFFLSLERKKQEQCYINELKNENGETTSLLYDIAENVQNYYQKLFSSEESDDRTTAEVLSNMNVSLSEGDKVFCDQEVREEEIAGAIKN